MSVIEAIPVEAPIETPIAEPFSIPEMDECELAALEFVNEIRARYGLEPIEALCSGIRKSKSLCVVSRSLQPLHVSTSGHFVHLYAGAGNLSYISIPPTVTRFVCRFDEGIYPHLVR